MLWIEGEDSFSYVDPSQSIVIVPFCELTGLGVYTSILSAQCYFILNKSVFTQSLIDGHGQTRVSVTDLPLIKHC